MQKYRLHSAWALGAVIAMAGCTTTTTQIEPVASTPAPPPIATQPVDPATLDPTNPIEDNGPLASLSNEPDIPLLGGYRNVNDPCRRAGESRYTRRYLDDSADLVACIRGGGAERSLAAVTGARPVAQTPSYTLFSVPRGAVQTTAAG